VIEQYFTQKQIGEYTIKIFEVKQSTIETKLRERYYLVIIESSKIKKIIGTFNRYGSYSNIKINGTNDQTNLDISKELTEISKLITLHNIMIT